MRNRLAAILMTGSILSGAAAAASAATVDFSSLPSGPLAAYDDLTFSLEGSADDGDPFVGSAFGSGEPHALLNSTTDDYPTAYTLNIIFGSASSGISFRFNNYGEGNGSNYVAYDAANAIVSSGDISSVNDFDLVTVMGSGITRLALNNGDSGGWLFAVSELTYFASGGAVPEPATWGLMIAGFGVAGGAIRRRRAVAA